MKDGPGPKPSRWGGRLRPLRKRTMALLGAAFAGGAAGLWLLVGCGFNAAGPNLRGLDYQPVAALLVLAAMVLLAPLVVAPPSLLGGLAFVLGAGLFVGIPAMGFLEDQGHRWCHRVGQPDLQSRPINSSA